MDTFTVSYVLLWAVVLVEGIAIVALLRTVGSLFLASRDAIERDGLAVGTELPAARFVHSSGGEMTRDDLLGKWTALIFAAPACRICRDLLPALPELQLDLADAADVYVIVRGGREDARLMAESADGVRIAALPDDIARSQFKVRVSPFVHIVAPDGRVAAKGLVNSRQDVEHLLAAGGLQSPTLQAHGHAYVQTGAES